MNTTFAPSGNQDFLATPEIRELAQRLTVARIKVMPDTLAVSIGGKQYGRDELLEHVEQADSVGTSMMELQVEFLRDLASGAVYDYA